jgi:hypothetical protein
VNLFFKFARRFNLLYFVFLGTVDGTILWKDMSLLFRLYVMLNGARGGALVEALRYKSIPDGVIGIFH